MQVFDHQAPRAITSHRRRGSTARDRPSALWHSSRSTANRVYTARLDVPPKTTEQNRIVRTGKSEVTKNKKNCARGIVLLKLTTDRHEASRGLFVTAELLVLYSMPTCCKLYARREYQKSTNMHL